MADRDDTTDDVIAEWAGQTLERMPADRKSPTTRAELEARLKSICNLARQTPELHMIPPSIRQTMREHYQPPAPVCPMNIPRRQLLRWRDMTTPQHIKEKCKDMPQHTQRELELQLAKRWREHILSKLIPYADSFPKFRVARTGALDVMRAYHDLFGKDRFATLAGHGRKLDKILIIFPGFIPWDTVKCLKLFELMRRAHEEDLQELHSNAPNNYWHTIQYLSKITGLDEDLDYVIILRKRDAVRATLTVMVVRQDKRALAPTIEVVMALERATDKASCWFYAWFASVARHGCGASGRYNDYQHSSDVSHRDLVDTDELEAWQTKVTDPLSQARPMPLIAPKISFTGIEWWTTFSEGLRELQKTIGKRDYIVPTPSKDRRRILPKPMGNNQALRIYQQVLIEGGLGPDAAKAQTLNGWRVFMPELAYKAGIQKERRAYLGRWAGETMADTYTRDHRTVICSIWSEVLQVGEHLKQQSPTKVPINLSDPYYGLKKKNTEGRGKHWGAIPNRHSREEPMEQPGSAFATTGSASPPVSGSRPDGVPEHTEEPDDLACPGLFEEDWAMEDGRPTAKSTPQTGGVATPTHRLDEKDDQQSYTDDGFGDHTFAHDEDFLTAEDAPPRRLVRLPVADRIPFDMVDIEDGGPLQLVVNKDSTWSESLGRSTYKAHFLRSTGRCVCGWEPTLEQITVYDFPDDWKDDYGDYKSCIFCWRLYTINEAFSYEPGLDPINIPGLLDEDELERFSSDGELPIDRDGVGDRDSSSDPASASDQDTGALLPTRRAPNVPPNSSSDSAS